MSPLDAPPGLDLNSPAFVPQGQGGQPPQDAALQGNALLRALMGRNAPQPAGGLWPATSGASIHDALGRLF